VAGGRGLSAGGGGAAAAGAARLPAVAGDRGAAVRGAPRRGDVPRLAPLPEHPHRCDRSPGKAVIEISAMIDLSYMQPVFPEFAVPCATGA
jgi:hypothetical protein